jgi:hypothetical protein
MINRGGNGRQCSWQPTSKNHHSTGLTAEDVNLFQTWAHIHLCYQLAIGTPLRFIKIIILIIAVVYLTTL